LITILRLSYRICLSFFFIAVLVVLVSLLSLTADAQTVVTGDIDVDTTWTLDGSPYIIEPDLHSSIYVREGALLTIEPGVEVQFYDFGSIRVEGRIFANGTAAMPIKFRLHPSLSYPVDWYSVPLEGWHSVLNYCEFYDAYTPSQVQGRYQTISNCTFVRCTNGVRLQRTRHVLLENLTFADAGNGGITIYDCRKGSGNIIRNCVINGASNRGVSIDSSNDVAIFNCTLSNSRRGIQVTSSNNIIIEGCTFINNTMGAYDSRSDSTFTNCTFVENSIGLYSNGETTVRRCVFRSNDIGTQLRIRGDIRECIYQDNLIGINVTRVYNNVTTCNFLNNKIHAQIYEQNRTNTWDNGTAGNYWDNFTTPDSNGDGIVDEPFVLDPWNSDNYPLADPIDLTAPNADAGPDIMIDQHETLVLDGSSSTDDFYITRYIWTFFYNGSQVVLEGERVAFAFDKIGDYRVILTVVDSRDNVDKDRVWIKVSDVDPPILMEDHTPLTVGTGNLFNISAAYVDNTRVFSVAVEMYQEGSSNSTFLMLEVSPRFFTRQKRAYDEPTLLNYRFLARDIWGNWEYSSWRIIAVIDDDAPFIEDLSPSEGTSGDPYTISVTIVENIGLDRAWLSSRTGMGAFSNTSLIQVDGRYEATVMLPNSGTLEYTVHAQDVSGLSTDLAIRSVQIIDNDPPVLFDDGTPSYVTRRGIITFRVSAWDNVGLEGLNVVVSAPDLPTENLSMELVEGDAFVLEFDTFDYVSDRIEYVFWARDGIGLLASTSKREIEVLSVPPAITTEPVTEVTEGQEYRVEYFASDPDTPFTELVWNLDTDASWLSFDNENVRLVGTPGPLDVGTYSVNVSVDDPEGGTAYQEFILLVLDKDVRPTVVILAPTPGLVIMTTALVEGTASDDIEIVSVELRVAGGDWQLCSGTVLWSFQLEPSEFEVGDLRIEVRAWDDHDHSNIEEIMLLVEHESDPGNGHEPTNGDDGGGQSPRSPLTAIMIIVLTVTVVAVLTYLVLRRRGDDR